MDTNHSVCSSAPRSGQSHWDRLGRLHRTGASPGEVARSEGSGSCTCKQTTHSCHLGPGSILFLYYFSWSHICNMTPTTHLQIIIMELLSWWFTTQLIILQATQVTSEVCYIWLYSSLVKLQHPLATQSRFHIHHIFLLGKLHNLQLFVCFLVHDMRECSCR